jgi:uncharacterized protein YqeY
MSLLERLNSDMKQAMKNKEKDKLITIRMVKASLQNEAIKLGTKDLSEEVELTILSREVKQRKESLHEFDKAGRQDLVDKLRAELAIVELYLPKQLSEEELSEIVKETVSEVGAKSKADMGKVMAAIMPKVKGKADGSLVTLESAIANAEHNDGADIDELTIKSIYVEQGATLKRFSARAKGRGNRISKPTCHIFVTVGN